MNLQLSHVARGILNTLGGRERGVKSYRAATAQPPNDSDGGHMWNIWPTDPDPSKGGGEGVNGPLCRQCQRIDWLKILKKCRIAKWESLKSDYRPEKDRVRPTKLRGLRVWDFKDETNRNCPLCNWFPPQEVSIEPWTTFQGGCSVHAFSGANFCQTIKELNSKVDICTFEAYSGAEFYVFIILHDYELDFSVRKLSKVFSIVPDNDAAAKLGPPRPMFRLHREVRPQIDTSLLKHWLQTCHKEHHGCSSMGQNSLGTSLPYGLRVVDCVQEQVIPAPAHCEYVALSYVWGRREVFAFEQRPKTIRDAMSLTLSLGKRYLWVDKYCVEQAPQTEEAKEHKRRQLDAMGLTYECSFATIAAVEGISEDHGLCGVGTSRKPQPSIVVGDVKLVKDWDERSKPYIVLAEYSPKIETCWGTRAWTYQEALLSPRVLFLYGTEVYFECRSMSCRESDALVIQREPLWCVQEGLAVVSHKELITVGGEDKNKEVLHLFWKCAQEYNTRLLTFDNDAMIAFQGVLQRFATPPDNSDLEPLPTACGTPLLDIFSGSHLTLDPSSIILGISWYNQSSIRQVRRRRNQDGTYPLPSWTWLAWEATLVPPRALDFSHKYAPTASVSQEPGSPSKCLRIKAPIHEPTILAGGWPVRSFEMTPVSAPDSAQTETDGAMKHARSIALLYTYTEVRVGNTESYSDMVFVMLIKWLDEARTKAKRIGGEPIHRRFFEHLTEEELLGNEREFLLY